MQTISGQAFIFANNIDTDQIYPGRYLELVDPQEIAKHCLEGANPDFIHQLRVGDIVVAGKNFGCGSSREHAVITLVHAGVGAVVAESFGRIFYRNAINLGLPVLVCPGIAAQVREGDMLEINLKEGTVLKQRDGEIIQGEKLSDYVIEILQSGGIKPLFKKRGY